MFKKTDKLKRVRGSKAIVVHNQRILLLLRDNIPTIYAPNQWSLPGGVVEKGESFKQGLFRECKEEIGVTPSSISYLGKFKHEYEDLFIVQYVYFFELTDEEADKLELGDEGQKMEFFDFSELKKLDIAEPSALILKKYFGCGERAI